MANFRDVRMAHKSEIWVPAERGGGGGAGREKDCWVHPFLDPSLHTNCTNNKSWYKLHGNAKKELQD